VFQVNSYHEKAAKELGILPAHYPKRKIHNSMPHSENKATGLSTKSHITTTEEIIQDFPSIFNGEIANHNKTKLFFIIMSYERS